MLDEAVHIVHVVLAGVWLGGVVFTTAVVSPALKKMDWSEPERVAVRSVIGGQYARVAAINLVLLAAFAVLDGLVSRFGLLFYAEYTLIALLIVLVTAHGAYFGSRLSALAEAEKGAESIEKGRALAERRRELQRVSFRVSMLDLLVSVVIAVLAAGA